MKGLKKTLTIAWILCVVACVFSVYNLVLELKDVTSKLYVFYAGLQVVLCLITAGIYFVYSLKKEQEIIKKVRLFYTICFVNIFNNIIAWAVSFWVEIVVGRTLARARFKNVQVQPVFEEVENKDVVDMNEEDYEIKKSADVLSKKLEELDEKLKNNEITQEQYNQLKNEVINKYMN